MEKTVKIKGMVCRRCIDIVKQIFQSQGFPVYQVKLGEVIYDARHNSSLEEVDKLLSAEGFEILTDKQTIIINRVKDLIENEFFKIEDHSKSFAALVTDTLHMDYDTLSTLFSHTEGIKLEQYIIQKRVEKVQELLKFTQQSLTDIASLLGYSSVHHLSNQFKKITGMSPSAFRELHTEQESLLQ